MLWVNNNPIKNDQLILDDGFWFGRGVFETIRVHEAPLFWEQHIHRLNAGLNALQIRPPVDSAALLEQLNACGIRQCVLKLAVTPENIVFQTRPIPTDDTPGYSLMPVDNLRSRNPLITGNKCLNYLDNHLARTQAAEQGYDDALFVDQDGTVSETCRANIFFYKDGILQTPDLSCGLLNGIIRQWVMERYPARTGVYTYDDLLAADSVFVTNSVIGVRPVTRIGGRECQVSSLTLEVHNKYLSEL